MARPSWVMGPVPWRALARLIWTRSNLICSACSRSSSGCFLRVNLPEDSTAKGQNGLWPFTN